MTSWRQQPTTPPAVLNPPPPTFPPRDTFVALTDRYPIPPPPETGSLQHLIASHPRLQLFVQPRRWTKKHLSLLSVSIIDEDGDDAAPALPGEFADLEPSEGDFEEIVGCIEKLPEEWDLRGAQEGMDVVMGAVLKAVLKAEGGREGCLVRGEFVLNHTLHILYARKAHLLRPQEAAYNSHHGYRIPLFALPSPSATPPGEGKHRLVWAYLGPADVFRGRRSMMARGAGEWEVGPWAVGVLIQLGMEAMRKEGRVGRDEVEVTVFVGDYDADEQLKLTRFTSNIHTSFLIKFRESRKKHEGEMLVLRKEWPVEGGFVGDLFEAVAEASLSEAAVGEWERGVVRVELEGGKHEDEDGDMEGGEEEGSEDLRGVKRKAEGMTGGLEVDGREEMMDEDDSPAFL